MTVVQDAAVLDVGVTADANAMNVTADDHARPHAGARPDVYIADHQAQWIEPRIRSDFGRVLLE